MTKDHHIAWLGTVLAVNGSAAQRRAFIDGYNGCGLTKYASPLMQEKFALGRKVRDYLHGKRDA